jgi:glycogen synthase
VTSPERVVETLQIGMSASRRNMSGTDRYFLALARELPSYRIGVRGMVIGEPGAVEDAVAGIESFVPEGGGRFARIRGARAMARRLVKGADLVVSHGAAHTSYILDAIGRHPLVSHFHGPWALEGREEGVGRAIEFVRRAQETIVYRRSLRFIVLSRAFAATLEREYGVDPARVRVIPGGVDLERFHPGSGRSAARAQLGWPSDRPIVVAARRLEPTKGIGALLDAAAIVRARVPDVLFAITGTGTLADSLCARARALGLDGNVRFCGHVSDQELPVMYRAADYSIVPSNAWEGFGLAVLESLACGTPAFVTPVGGLPEVVRPLAPQFVMLDTSVGAIADGILAALGDGSRAPDAAACVAYAREFSWSAIARKVAEVYREVA